MTLPLDIPSKSRRSRPKVGLALGSGSARGLAHIGVIHAIEEAGITIDMVAGSSIGALIGAAYASGQLGTLEQDFRGIDWKRMGTLLDPVFPRSGLIDGKKITEFVRAHVAVKDMRRLPVPLCVIATDLTNGEEVVLRDGDLVEAVRASISVPAIFSPVRHGGRILVDGGLANPVPVSAVRALGADIVIAVDLNYDIVAGKARRGGSRRPRAKRVAPPKQDERNSTRVLARIGEALRASDNPAFHRIRGWLERDRLPGMMEVLLGSLHILQVRITESRLLIEKPDILIRPPLSSVHFLEFDRADEMIAIGYRSALGPSRELARRLSALDYQRGMAPSCSRRPAT
jgi:NTE family protein